jgi:hypothetical protein
MVIKEQAFIILFKFWKELYFIIFQVLLMKQRNSFYISKVSRDFTEIQIEVKNFINDLLIYVFNFYRWALPKQLLAFELKFYFIIII